MKIIKDTKDELEIEITGESHTLCNALRKTLMEDKDVESAAYVMEHPIIGEPKLYIKAKNPKKSLKKAAETIKSRCDELKKDISTPKKKKTTTKAGSKAKKTTKAGSKAKKTTKAGSKAKTTTKAGSKAKTTTKAGSKAKTTTKVGSKAKTATKTKSRAKKK